MAKKRKHYLNQYDMPTKRWASRMGDFFLVLIPVIEAFVAAAPESDLSHRGKFYISFATSVVLVSLKFWFKGYKEDIEVKDEEPNSDEA